MSEIKGAEQYAMYPWMVDYIQKLLMWALVAPEEETLGVSVNKMEVTIDGELMGWIYTGDEARFVPVEVS